MLHGVAPSHFKNLQDLVAVVVDHLDGDLTGFRGGRFKSEL
jgi:hypothetical protein